MHANIDQLLDIRDGLQNEMSEHVANCQTCQGEMQALVELGDRWFSQIDAQPGEHVWERIQSSLPANNDAIEDSAADNVLPFAQTQPVAASTQQSLTRAIYSLAASIAFVGVVAVFMFSGQRASQIEAQQQTQIIQASINELMMNSRGLEQVLQEVAQQNQALSVANQEAADRLYWRLTYVDQLIHEADPQNAERMKVLWNNRISALNELNQIYYQRDAVSNTPEI